MLFQVWKSYNSTRTTGTHRTSYGSSLTNGTSTVMVQRNDFKQSQSVHLCSSGLSSLKFLSQSNLKWAHVLSQTAHPVVWHNNYSDQAHCILNANFSSWFACCWVQCCTVWHWSNLYTLYSRFLSSGKQIASNIWLDANLATWFSLISVTTM